MSGNMCAFFNLVFKVYVFIKVIVGISHEIPYDIKKDLQLALQALKIKHYIG